MCTCLCCWWVSAQTLSFRLLRSSGSRSGERHVEHVEESELSSVLQVNTETDTSSFILALKCAKGHIPPVQVASSSFRNRRAERLVACYTLSLTLKTLARGFSVTATHTESQGRTQNQCFVSSRHIHKENALSKVMLLWPPMNSPMNMMSQEQLEGISIFPTTCTPQRMSRSEFGGLSSVWPRVFDHKSHVWLDKIMMWWQFASQRSKVSLTVTHLLFQSWWHSKDFAVHLGAALSLWERAVWGSVPCPRTTALTLSHSFPLFSPYSTQIFLQLDWSVEATSQVRGSNSSYVHRYLVFIVDFIFPIKHFFPEQLWMSPAGQKRPVATSSDMAAVGQATYVDIQRGQVGKCRWQ